MSPAEVFTIGLVAVAIAVVGRVWVDGLLPGMSSGKPRACGVHVTLTLGRIRGGVVWSVEGWVFPGLGRFIDGAAVFIPVRGGLLVFTVRVFRMRADGRLSSGSSSR